MRRLQPPLPAEGGCRPGLLAPVRAPNALFFFSPPGPPTAGRAGRRRKNERLGPGTRPVRPGLHPPSAGKGPWNGPDSPCQNPRSHPPRAPGASRFFFVPEFAFRQKRVILARLVAGLSPDRCSSKREEAVFEGGRLWCGPTPPMYGTDFVAGLGAVRQRLGRYGAVARG